MLRNARSENFEHSAECSVRSSARAECSAGRMRAFRGKLACVQARAECSSRSSASPQPSAADIPGCMDRRVRPAPAHSWEVINLALIGDLLHDWWYHYEDNLLRNGLLQTKRTSQLRGPGAVVAKGEAHRIILRKISCKKVQKKKET